MTGCKYGRRIRTSRFLGFLTESSNGRNFLPLGELVRIITIVFLILRGGIGVKKSEKIKLLQEQSLDLKNNLEELQSDMNGLTALLHTSLEGIRTDSVGLDEIINAVLSLYQLSDILTNKLERIRQEFDYANPY